MTFELKYPPRRLINAESRRSDLGGATLPPEVREAMLDAGCGPVDMYDMLEGANKELAELTGNEAAHVVPGAAAGLALATLAAMAEGDPAKTWQLRRPLDEHQLPSQVVVQASHLSPYGAASELVGAKLRIVGNRDETPTEEFEAALGPQTAAVLFVPARDLPFETLSLAEVVARASTHAVPVIVDAAAQLPPVDNLSRFTTNLGADIAVFSGGKDLAGPGASGLIVGKQQWIECCRSLMYPHHHLARSFKVSKEEVAGLVAAVRRYVAMDHDARRSDLERICATWLSHIDGLPGITATRQFPNEAGQELPRVRIELDASQFAVGALEIRQRLRQRDPAIAVSANETNSLFITPETLAAGEDRLVIDALESELGSARREAGREVVP